MLQRAQSPALLRVRDLTIAFPTRAGSLAFAANQVSFDLWPGETLGIVGESGCGKSVTLRALIGLVPYPGQVAGGSVQLGGEELTGFDKREWQRARGSRIGMIFQDPMTSLNPLFTIGDQLIEVLRLKRGLGAREAREEAVGILERVGIEPASSRLADHPHQLSGGMRQRVMIAIAVAARPQLLLADEPTTALDVRVQQQILKLIGDLRREMGMATILVSHDVAVVGQICDEVAVMYAGRIVERGPVDDVLDQPRHPYTEGLIRAVEQVNTLSGSAGSSLETMPGQPPALTDLGAGCSFAPRCPLRQPECERFDMRLDEPSQTHPAACLVRQREIERSEVM